MYCRAGVVGDQDVFEFTGSSAERVGKYLRDPQGVSVLEGEPADRVLRGQQLDPLLLGAFGNTAQDRIDESCSALAVFGADQIDRSCDGSVRCDTMAQTKATMVATALASSTTPPLVATSP